MGRITDYKKFLTGWLADYAHIKPANLPQLENHVLADYESGHFQLLREGWDKNGFVFNVIFHFQVKPDGKIWVLVNNTDIDLGQEFQQLGVPADDLVPGFHPAEWRRMAGYAA